VGHAGGQKRAGTIASCRPKCGPHLPRSDESWTDLCCNGLKVGVTRSSSTKFTRRAQAQLAIVLERERRVDWDAEKKKRRRSNRTLIQTVFRLGEVRFRLTKQ